MTPASTTHPTKRNNLHPTLFSYLLDLLVGSVSKNLSILMLNQLGKAGKALLDNFKRWRGVLVPAQVRDCPGHVPQESSGGVGLDQSQQRLDNAVVDHVVSHDRSISRNVPKRPNGLLADIVVRTPQQLHEVGHSAGVHHSLSLIRSSAGDVSQRPGGLELQHRVVAVAEELDQPGQDS